MRLDLRATAKYAARRHIEQERSELRLDQWAAAIKDRSPAEIAQWVEANINTLADAKRLLKVLAAAVALMLRE